MKNSSPDETAATVAHPEAAERLTAAIDNPDFEAVARRITITVEEAASLLGIGRSAAYDAARRGQLPTRRLGRRLFVPVPALLEWLGASGHSRPEPIPQVVEEAGHEPARERQEGAERNMVLRGRPAGRRR